MSKMMNGVVRTKLNERRFTLPLSMKQKFSDDAMGRVVITLGLNNSIAVYPLDNWEEYCLAMENGTDLQYEYLNYLRKHSTEQKLEKTNRIRLGKKLLNLAGIKEDIVICGSGKFVEIWDVKTFDTTDEKNQKRFSNIDPKKIRIKVYK